MVSITVFLILLVVFMACVWYATTQEDLTPGQARPGPLTRALRRVRKRRSSPKAAAGAAEESKSGREMSRKPQGG